MNTTGKKVSNLQLNAISLGIALCWSVVIVALAGWNYWESYRATLESARSSAYENYRKDLLYRLWGTEHGAVYVPITPKTQPNPYLAHIPERDISTPSGRKLTLVNPAYMTRQAHELGKKEYGQLGHITSLNPISPENVPDDWERSALQAFERGQQEVSSLEPLGNGIYLRFMRPLITEGGCLKCHGVQGYQVGAVRGGISVSLPWGPFREALRSQLRVIILAYGGIWVIGILGLYLGKNRLQNHLSERKRMEEQLKENEALLRESQLIAGLGSYVLDIPTGLWRSSDVLDKIFGIDAAYERSVEGWAAIIHPDDRTMMSDYFKNEVLGQGHAFDKEYRILRQDNQAERWVHGLGKLEFDTEGRPLKMHGTIQDITDRKQAEKKLKESEERYRALSIIDGLTQLYNSRHFYDQLKMEVNRLKRYAQPLTLLLLDLDDFKAYNDAFGHIEGDQVLLRLGQVVKRCLRQTDSAYRYGGEEFTVILPMTTAEDGALTAERIRAELKNEHFSPVPGKDVQVTVSIGLAQYKTQEDLKAFVHRVDQLMYRAKKNGKDRVYAEFKSQQHLQW